MGRYSIGQLAQLAHVPASTLRYYERAGLLRADARSAGNYRQYGEAALERLRFIRSAQATGLSLEGVAELLSLTTSSGSPCDEVESVLRERLADVDAKMRDLRRVKRALTDALTTCCNGKKKGICEAVIDLKKNLGRIP